MSITVTRQCIDRRITDTAERLIEIYKQQFGADWQQAYCQTVSLGVPQT